MATTQDVKRRVEAALREVPDPTVDADAVASGLVGDVTVEGADVRIEAGLSEIDDEKAQERLSREIRDAVARLSGVDDVSVEPAGGPAEASGLADFDRIVAVASAKGGVGKSTVATGLACALAGEESVGLFDADLHGPNVPTLLDVSGPVRADDAGNPTPVTVDGSGDGEGDADGDGGRLEVMSAGLLGSETPLGWRGAMAHEAVSDLFADTAWSAGGTLVIDLPPGTGDVVLTTLQEVPVDGVVVVTTPFETSVGDTVRSVELFRDEGVPVLGTVVNMAGFTCPSCGDTHALFGEDGADPTADLGAPLLAELPFDRELQSAAEPGDVPDPLFGLAESVRTEADEAWTVDPPDGTVDIRDAPAADRRERVRTTFESLPSGEPFRLLSDRDPSPVVGFLADLADEPAGAFETTVERPTPEAWLLSTAKP